MKTAEKKIATSKPVTAVAGTPVPAKVTTTPAAAAPKGAPRVAAKPAAKKPAATAKAATKPMLKPKTEKPAKAKKPKLVRDSFTIPKTEYAVLKDLKQRAGKHQVSVRKSELLRAGIKALSAMSEAGYLVALKAVPAIKTGRPTKD